MNRIQSNFDIPRKDYGFICYMLYKKNDLKFLVKQREDFIRERYIEKMCVTTHSYYEAYQKDNNTLENIIIKIDEDYKINKYKKLHIIIREYLNELKEKNNLKYKLIKLKYFEKKSYYDISKELDVTVGTLRTMNYEIISYIYCVGLDNQIFKEVKVCRNVKL